MTGKVRWYSRQGYGFVDDLNSRDGVAYYFHITDVKNQVLLKTGDLVTFEPTRNSKGLRAIKVCAVRNTKEVSQCPQPATT